MATTTTCPGPDRLQGLLDGSLSAGEQSTLTDHVGSCPNCQGRLDALAAGDLAWSPAALRQGDEDRPPANSAFWATVSDLARGAPGRDDTPRPSPARTPPAVTVAEAGAESGEVSLDFLDASDSPEYVGLLGHFGITSVIGRGGMGMVLRAFDQCLQRPVAIKVLDPRVAKDETARQRFCREARAAAAITHEHVVAIHQVEHEEAKDLPYLVMQYVPGTSLQDRLDREGALPLAEILRIGAQTAAGLAAAHGQGLIHRDIKPANILLEEGTGRVRLTDFGLARAAEDVKLTQTGFVAGTPLYMAPEQARGEALDHRADLFSLGSVLYAMATGRPPFEGSTPFVVLRAVTEQDPRPIHEINPAVPDWLVDAIERLHEKHPDDRYQSAVDVAALLSRRLAELPPTALPTPSGATTRRSGWRWNRRNRGRLWALAAFALWVALGALLLAEVGGLIHILPRPAKSADAEVPSAPPRMILNAQTGPVWAVAFSPDGTRLAMALDDGTVKLWDPATGSPRLTLAAHAGPVWSVAFSPDGKLLATGSDDGTAKLWEIPGGRERKELNFLTGIRPVAFSADGKQLVTGARNGAVLIWDVAKGSESVTPKGHAGVVMAAQFTPDGMTAVTAGSDKTIRLWDAASGQEQNALSGHAGGVYTLAISPDGTKLASGGWDKAVRVWDVATGNLLATLQGHEQDVWSVAFSPDGRLLASGSEDRTLKLWDVAAGAEVATYRGHAGTVYAVAFAPDGKTVAGGGRDGTVRLWDVAGR
jgi:eukaryotic-like serine/threonine-protein kinase